MGPLSSCPRRHGGFRVSLGFSLTGHLVVLQLIVAHLQALYHVSKKRHDSQDEDLSLRHAILQTATCLTIVDFENTPGTKCVTRAFDSPFTRQAAESAESGRHGTTSTRLALGNLSNGTP